MKLSLVIPCFNEAASLPSLLERCKDLGACEGIEVILVDNGSTDHSAQVFEDLLPSYPGCRVLRIEENKGYGFGVLSGLREAKGDLVGWTHADLQTDPQDVLAGLKLFELNRTDIYVKGKRYGRPFLDVVFTVCMSIFETLLLGKRFWDINAQPNLFSRRFFESWVNPPNDFSLDLYAYYQAHAAGIQIIRFPVFFGQRRHGVSHWNVNWAGKWKFIRRTVEFSLVLRKKIAQ